MHVCGLVVEVLEVVAALVPLVLVFVIAGSGELFQVFGHLESEIGAESKLFLRFLAHATCFVLDVCTRTKILRS